MYPHKEIEQKWRFRWEKGFVDYTSGTQEKSKLPKKYILVEFPYPSGAGLHVGHMRSYVALDILSRKLRMQGFDVMYPLGWDAFGLPTENYAIKNKINPQKATADNIANFKNQLAPMGLSFDWSKEINTTDPEYYKWTQWIFLKLFEHGLAYKAESPVFWAPESKITLAAEEVEDGKSIQTGEPVVLQNRTQWMLKITEYADKLLEGLDTVDYLPAIKEQQRNWIGKSRGVEIDFKMHGVNMDGKNITVFTTRPDTLFGVVAVMLAPEYALMEEIIPHLENADEVRQYVDKSRTISERDRKIAKEKTGVMLKGLTVVHPLTDALLAVYVADYVLGGYGTGAVMNVPAHDERDFEFAKKYDLPIKKVVIPSRTANVFAEGEEIYEGEGILVNSDVYSGMTTKVAWESIADEVENRYVGQRVTKYKMRDWVFSRQRYWGEPIPIIYCDKCGTVTVPEEDLPVKLPDVIKYEPTDTGESPLAGISEFVNTMCPKCGGPARRETDTMPNWAGSSWYYLRYIDPHNDKVFAGEQKLKEWLPVDVYNGGMEHVTLHLLYSRFWHKFLYDIGLVPVDEPYQKRLSHGLILAEGGVKMSKSKGNTIDPLEMVDSFGADSLRLYEMFMGPYDETIAWNTHGLMGCYRFLNKVWEWGTKNVKTYEYHPTPEFRLKVQKSVHKLIKKISEDIENMKFNTAVSSMMEFVNEWQSENIEIANYETFFKLLAPFAPHITEELWEVYGYTESIHFQKWPEYDPKLIEDEKYEYIIQINGKVRGSFEIDKTEDNERMLKHKAFRHSNVSKYLVGKEIKKVVIIPKKIINIVI
jgi:leucyl-tRNA synthetase